MGESLIPDILDNLINQAAVDLGYNIYESSVFLKGGKSQIVVKIDHVKGISHGDCEKYSRELSRRLDEQNLLPNYSLEISSPGLSRKIRSIDEFIRFTGAPVKVIFEQDGKRVIFKGAVKNVIDTIVELKSDKETFTVDFKDIIRANLEY